MKYVMITGTSRGIGAAMAAQLMGENYHIFCIARTNNEQLLEGADMSNNRLSSYPFNLNHLGDIEQLFTEIFYEINCGPPAEAIYLINNAGMLSPVVPIERAVADSIIENVTINLLAPMIMTSNFIKQTQKFNLDKRILNISSGSAKYLMPSQSCYSTSKAAVDSFSKSVSLEQMNLPYPVKVASVYPGMIDTQMQSEIRAVSQENFPYVEQFKQLAQEGRLQTPEYTAQRLIDILLHEDFGSVAVIEEL
ncbi:(S)-benzoin forming benzil reductase [Paenibacillaceae bacterium]|nr:(S)-benzoin forming benzil reductase [Paenibacillaceae bacterium]